MQKTIFCSYSQLAIFNPISLQKPFNSWSEHEVDQGFTWKKHSTSFGLINNSGDVHIKIYRETNKQLHINGALAIMVPFVVIDRKIEIASISESFYYDLDNSTYQLYFFHWEDSRMHVALVFEKCDEPVFSILSDGSKSYNSSPPIIRKKSDFYLQ